jgi:hypothetical protein
MCFGNERMEMNKNIAEEVKRILESNPSFSLDEQQEIMKQVLK